MSQVSRRSEVAYINGAPSTPGYLLALVPELSQCPRALTQINKQNQVRKMKPVTFFVPVQRKGWKFDPHVSNLGSREFLFRGLQVHP